jgi:tetratricopeptide (TPR) repeat protein
MKSIQELHQEANNLRQEKKFAEAIPLYEKIWSESSAQYDGAGLLHCLRKTNHFEKAIPLAHDLIMKYPDFAWGRNEVIWTFITGKLNILDEDTPLEDVINLATEIMVLKPEDLAAKICVFKVLRAAKAAGKWDVVGVWADKLNPEKLSATPMTDKKGREGWSDQSLWYNYKCKSLIEQDRSEEIFQLIDRAIYKYPKQRKFLLRLKALALHKMNMLDEAAECYKDLCSVRNPDWWLLHEYARIHKDKNNREDALRLMCQAANSNRKLELMVTLFQEMGIFFKENDEMDVARSHLVLSYLIRQEQGWSIPREISDSISELNMNIGNDVTPVSVKDALFLCQKKWESILGIGTSSQSKSIKGLSGRVHLGRPDRVFCFISKEPKTDESYFCLKSDLPLGAVEGSRVIFTAISSFDRKKNCDSWKAADIKLMV